VVLRIFGLSIGVTLLALGAAVLYGGPQALVLAAILGVLEVSLSFDNAIINATVLERMSEFWQRMFLTVGILVAVVGMRLLFPLLIVWATAGLGPVEALQLALNPPADGAAYFPDGTPSYETAITGAHPQIAAFGGMFLFMLFLDFVFEDRELTWLSWIEDPLQKVGRLPRLAILVAGTALVLVGMFLAEPDDQLSVLVAGLLGLLTYVLVNGLGELFSEGLEHRMEDGENAAGDADTDRDADGDSDTDGADAGSDSRGGPSELAKATGRAGFFLFLYLEVLDASFSFDGVVGAFAITADPVIIALGLGFIGAMFVRSITIYLVRTGTLSEYEYLEHGAHWAIGALAVILLVSVDHHLQLPEVVTGLVGVVFIGAALASSVYRNRHTREREGDAGRPGVSASR